MSYTNIEREVRWLREELKSLIEIFFRDEQIKELLREKVARDREYVMQVTGVKQ